MFFLKCGKNIAKEVERVFRIAEIVLAFVGQGSLTHHYLPTFVCLLLKSSGVEDTANQRGY